jgi:hypothetical protein
MPRSRWGLVAGFGGIAFVFLFLQPLFSATPSPLSGPPSTAPVFVQHQDLPHLIQSLRAFGAVGFLVLLVGLQAMLRRVEGGAGMLTTTVVVAGVMAVATGVVTHVARQAIQEHATAIQDPAVVQTIQDLADAAETFTSVLLAELVGLASWVLLGSRGATHWIGWAGLFGAPLLLVGAVSLITGPLPFPAVELLGYTLWFGALTITMVVRAARREELIRPWFS